MIKSYAILALRNIIRNKGFALLNIVGFASGLTACLLIMLFISDELNYDKFNKNHNTIFRVDTELKYGGTITSFAITAPPVAQTMLYEFPEVSKGARLSAAFNIRIKKGNENIQEDQVVFADPSIFDMFSFHVLAGTLTNALADPASTVISKTIALKYFGTIQATGETLAVAGDSSLYIVAAVIDDMPAQSHFHADLFLPLLSQDNSRGTSFTQFSVNTYVMLKHRDDVGNLAAKLPAFIRKHLASDMNVNDFEKGGNYIRLQLMPLDDIHLFSNKQRELEANSDITYVYIFATIAVLIILLACVNFINLFTARSANRAKEVGVRKVMGSVKANVIVQFLVEAFMMTVVSMAIAFSVAIVCLPLLNTITSKNLEFTSTTLISLLPMSLVLILIVSFVAGIYPAFYLASLQPAKVLKGELSSGFKMSSLRNTLVVFQFSIATFLVLGTLVVLSQLEFIQSKNVGFNREQVIVVHHVGNMSDPNVFKHEIKQLSGVVNASLSGYLPTNGSRWQNSVSSKNYEGLLAEFWSVDPEYIETLEIKLNKGRNFSPVIASDSSAIILNESAARSLMLDGKPLQRQIEAGGENYTIIGIVNDFNFESLRQNVTPLAMVLGGDWQANLIVRTEAGQIRHVLEQVRLAWAKLNPSHDFEFSFMDEDFEAVYRGEQRMQSIFTIFTGLAIVIATLGLLGLAAYAAEQRIRELAVRKVLGATPGSLFSMMTLEFMRPVLISLLIALPISWWIMEQWLNGFAYRVKIPIDLLSATALLIPLIALIATIYQTLKAALSNPVKGLRSE